MHVTRQIQHHGIRFRVISTKKAWLLRNNRANLDLHKLAVMYGVQNRKKHYSCALEARKGSTSSQPCKSTHTHTKNLSSSAPHLLLLAAATRRCSAGHGLPSPPRTRPLAVVGVANLTIVLGPLGLDLFWVGSSGCRLLLCGLRLLRRGG